MGDTLANYRVRVRRYLHEVTPSESFFTEDLLNNLLNASYKRRCGQIIMAYEGCFVQTATRNVIGGQEIYAWPTNFERLLKLEFVDPSGVRTPIQRFERHDESINPVGVGTFTFRPTGSGFIIQPVPQDSVGQWRMEFIQTPPSMTADGDTPHPDFPSILDEMIVLDAVVNCLDTESLMENGIVRSILRARTEYENDFDRWINSRMVMKQNISPFLGPYLDA